MEKFVDYESIKGLRDYMEDNFAYIVSDGVVVAMVCDGHGGKDVTNITAAYLPQLLVHAMKRTKGYNNSCRADVIRRAIMLLGGYLRKEKSGSTLTGIVADSKDFFSFNVGDSRTCFPLSSTGAGAGVVYSLPAVFHEDGSFSPVLTVEGVHKNFFCTQDHNPKLASEITRVANSGGVIIGGRLNGLLALTRSFGDVDVGDGLTYVPDIYWTRTEVVAGPVLMFSDGVYEGSPEQGNDVYYKISLEHGAKGLVESAAKRGSSDNITALLVNVQKALQSKTNVAFASQR